MASIMQYLSNLKSETVYYFDVFNLIIISIYNIDFVVC